MLDALLDGLAESGHVVELADLRAEGFDPRLPAGDEPDWDDPDKVYTPEVLAEQARMARNEALAFVFPVWWWSFPATTKGWIDRVWNHGWAYGGRFLPHRKALLLGTASGDREGYRTRRYEEAMRIQLLTGTMAYCGIPESELHLFYDVMGSDAIRRGHLETARQLGKEFFGRSDS